ncbi:MAG: glucose-6-phosphate isomerase, partial [Alphaproteobacteria bacterium]|nr:glucose-6-phosphate isomerase [Alphaproteobacteria bacterium]
MNASASNSWTELASLPRTPLAELIATCADRLGCFTLEVAGLYFDFSKTHLTPETLKVLAKLAESQGLAAARDALFAGAIVNPTENRAAEHTAERGEGAAESVAHAKALHKRMRMLIEVLDAGGFGTIKHIIHVGIGGSALGPNLMIDALGRDDPHYNTHIVSNIDGAALAEAFKACDPHTTLLAIASKTFTTSETMRNAASVIEWMEEAGVADPHARAVALTAAPGKAVEWGIDESRVLPFAESVGGRYSLWSSIGFPAAATLGWGAFEELLEGAAEMDRHFRLTPLKANAPALASFTDLYYTQVRAAETRAVFAYDERLRLLPAYLQQLEMESNGKSVTATGAPVSGPTAPITWGGVGTDGQHAVFQLLHQGTHLVPVEFVAVSEPGHDLDEGHHIALLQNCFAQSAALMTGRHAADGARNYPGDRPSTTILLDALTPRALGAL